MSTPSLTHSLTCILVGIDSSYRCGCITQNPCYWSSKPSPTNDAIEHITFSLGPRASVAVGFSITPYQAFFQPQAPTYSPAKVQLQFLKPKTKPLIISKVSIGCYTETDENLGISFYSFNNFFIHLLRHFKNMLCQRKHFAYRMILMNL